MQVIATYKVEGNIGNIRLLDFALQNIKEIGTRNGFKKAIKKGELLLNGEKATTGTFLKQNDTIDLLEPELVVHKTFELKLDVLYEDDYLAVIFKPSGIGVSGNYFRTIQNALPFNLKSSTQSDKLAIPHPVHRLDKPTCGLLIIAKTHSVAVKLGNMLEQKQINKIYHAIVIGTPSNENEISIPIEGKTAISKAAIIKTVNSPRFSSLTLVKLSPITGRTHQLRIHMAETGTPILGDKEYGNKVKNLWGKGLFLCATEIEFLHPISNTSIHLAKDLPNKFIKIIE